MCWQRWRQGVVQVPTGHVPGDSKLGEGPAAQDSRHLGQRSSHFVKLHVPAIRLARGDQVVEEGWREGPCC